MNDAWGGNDFTTSFKTGERVGVGMTFSVPRQPPSYGSGTAAAGSKMLDITVFFTRNGVREGSWDGNEELDRRSEGGNAGIEGSRDLFAAIGVFGACEFEVFFDKGGWLFRPG